MKAFPEAANFLLFMAVPWELRHSTLICSLRIFFMKVVTEDSENIPASVLVIQFVSLQANQQHEIPASLVWQSPTAHSGISQVCLICLMKPVLKVDKLSEDVLRRLPFSQYAAMIWYSHYEGADRGTNNTLDGLVLKLFKDGANANTDTPGRVGTALHATCSERNPNIVEILLNAGAILQQLAANSERFYEQDLTGKKPKQ
ncbi:hypothetical protein TSTA_054680 [Talaromyces stipitatus ATCC 10500]|uniref:Uncharacterized protein n=1 Tax=Talaromyces stipitatus (strain ATCC 10500 / CBS 375.48 / QM 6759 / NRRL 1006) TaxID=441959 RepID=B8MR63_TALSN|nr:uncharacterized protein TSTA_054680 [Talaromyces stipitatus ATCC 10500]EED12958.1 hypothetical protein TSTA_054680 [Talaromyces stipitatus ATCC 10500]